MTLPLDHLMFPAGASTTAARLNSVRRLMRQRRRMSAWGLACMVLALRGGAALAQEYTITDLGTLGGDYTVAYAINAAGQVVGLSQGASGSTVHHAFIWEDGIMTDLGLQPGSSNSAASDINDLGVVVGESRTGDPQQLHAVYWVNGEMFDLHPAGEVNASAALGVNNHNDIVGYVPIGTGPQRGALWRGTGGLTILPGLSDSESHNIVDAALDINDAGRIVGFATTDPLDKDRHAVQWQDGELTDLHFNSALANSQATAVNLHGEITGLWYPDQPEQLDIIPFYRTVGYAIPGPAGFQPADVNASGQVVGSGLFGTQTRAALWQNGELINLNTRLPEDTEWDLEAATGINDDGIIIGVGYLRGYPDVIRAFRMVPTDLDADGDGLRDSWESEGGGIDVNDDDTIDLDLFARGARPDHKDLFVEVDVMDRLPAVSAALNMVVDAFDDAPVGNPDGLNGIKLHLELAEASLPVADWDLDDLDGDGDTDWPSEFDTFKSMHWGSPAERGDANAENLLAAKRLAYRYCAIIHDMDTPDEDEGNQGLAELPGNDCIVVLGHLAPSAPYLDKIIAGLFMHEFGHNLGLHHGGADDINHKPNYISVMNYSWTYPSYWSSPHWFLDYSRFELLALNESNLDETAGLGGPAYNPYGALKMMHGATEVGGKFQIGFASPYDGNFVDWNANDDDERVRAHSKIN